MLGVVVIEVDRTDGVDHPVVREVEARRGDGPPDPQPVRQRRAPQLAARLEQSRPCSPVDRAIDATATEQRGVRSVDDRVDVGLPRQVAADDLDLHGHYLRT